MPLPALIRPPLPEIAPENVVLVLSRPVTRVLSPNRTWWPVGDPAASASEPKLTWPAVPALRSSVVLLDIATDELGKLDRDQLPPLINVGRYMSCCLQG